MSNLLIHFLFGLRNCPMLVALLLGLTALLGVAPPAVAQTLSNLELVAIYKVVPDTPLVIREHIHTNQPLLDYFNSDSLNFVDFSPSELAADATDSQSVTITSPNWDWTFHYFCANQDVRSLTLQGSKCRSIQAVSKSDERITIVSVLLKQDEINNGGVVWHVADSDGNSYGAKWIPIPELSPVTLNFSSSRHTYTGEIPSNANSLRIIPTASSDTIDVRVNSGSNTRVASGDTLDVSSLQSGVNSVNTVTVSVTAGGDTTSYTVTLSPNAVPSFGMATVEDKIFTSGQRIASFQVPAASGGDAPLTYSVSDKTPLPDGLTFYPDGNVGDDGNEDCPSTTARQICGKPTPRAESSNVTIEAEDSNGDHASLSFFINIVGVKTDPVALTESNLNGAKITLRLQNTKFKSQVNTSHFELDTEIQNVSFQLSETLVPGGGDVAVLILSFSGDSNFTTDQTLAVKVKAAGHQQSHDLTTASIDVTSDEDLTPTFGTATMPDTTYYTSVAVSDTLPAATGGDGTLTYTLTPGLPGGLTYTAATSGNGGVIAGKPTTATSANTYTLTATDSDGDTSQI